MTELTDDALKALLDGATPGPWRADGEPWNRVVWSSADNRVCFMAHSNGLNDERDIATSNLAAAAPDLARALIDARAERDRLRADAQAAVALVVERAAEEVDRHYAAGDMGNPGHWVRALAPADGLAAVDALRKERDALKADRDQWQEEVGKCIMACRPGPEGFRTSPASAGVYKMRQALDAAEADRDRLAAANKALEAQVGALTEAVKSFLWWADQKCPCENEQPNPCTLCGASVENLEACKAADNTLPRKLLAQARAALAEVQADARREGGE